MAQEDEQSLFRPEVAEARKQRLQGEIILAQPVRAHLLVLLFAVIIGVIASWIILGEYTRTETARGVLVTNVASSKVIATRAGLITNLLVEEGDLVEAGHPLAAVLVEQQSEVGGSAIAESLTSLEAQKALTDQQQGLARDRAQGERARIAATIEGIQQQRLDIASQIDLQKQVVRSTQGMFDRIESVGDRGFVSAVEIERRRQTAIVARQELSRLGQQLNGLSSQERQALTELSRIAADAGSAVANARASAESLNQQRAQLRSERAYTINAPIGGRVTALQAEPGRTVDPSVPIMVIVPEGSELHVDVYAPTRAIGFVKPGQEVRLLYDAFPYQRYGSYAGRITRISRTIIDPRELKVPLKIEEAVYRIEVKPEGQTVSAFGDKLPLQPGMTLSANLVLDRRSFGDWLLQPINAVLNRNR